MFLLSQHFFTVVVAGKKIVDDTDLSDVSDGFLLSGLLFVGV